MDIQATGPYKLKYFRDGHTDNVVVQNLSLLDDDLCIKYAIRLSDGRTIESTKAFLRNLSKDDVLSHRLENYRAKTVDLDPIYLENIMLTVTLTTFEQGLMNCHHSLQHILSTVMFLM